MHQSFDLLSAVADTHQRHSAKNCCWLTVSHESDPLLRVSEAFANPSIETSYRNCAIAQIPTKIESQCASSAGLRIMEKKRLG